MKLRAYAKLNLSLNVVGKRGNMHEIDSVMTSVDLFDEVTLLPRRDKTVTVSGVDGVQQQSNTAYKAAVKFLETFRVDGVDIVVEKHIPFCAGMGGSSADAAAVLEGLAAIYNVPFDSPLLRQIATEVGSDVYFMRIGGYARVSGCGEEVYPFEADRTMYYAVTKFDFPCRTAVVYNGFDEVGGDFCDNEKLVNGLENGQFDLVRGLLRNGLQRAVMSMFDYAESYLSVAKKCGYHPVMTGSGSAFFIPFADIESAAKACNTLYEEGFNTIVCQDVPAGVRFVDEIVD